MNLSISILNIELCRLLFPFLLSPGLANPGQWEFGPSSYSIGAPPSTDHILALTLAFSKLGRIFLTLLCVFLDCIRAWIPSIQCFRRDSLGNSVVSLQRFRLSSQPKRLLRFSTLPTIILRERERKERKRERESFEARQHSLAVVATESGQSKQFNWAYTPETAPDSATPRLNI